MLADEVFAVISPNLALQCSYDVTVYDFMDILDVNIQYVNSIMSRCDMAYAWPFTLVITGTHEVLNCEIIDILRTHLLHTLPKGSKAREFILEIEKRGLFYRAVLETDNRKYLQELMKLSLADPQMFEIKMYALLQSVPEYRDKQKYANTVAGAVDELVKEEKTTVTNNMMVVAAPPVLSAKEREYKEFQKSRMYARYNLCFPKPVKSPDFIKEEKMREDDDTTEEKIRSLLFPDIVHEADSDDEAKYSWMRDF